MVSQLTKSIVDPALQSGSQSRIITSTEHGIDPTKISPNAVEVVERLKSAGFDSELVGGCVRDLLLDREPKDFDVATSARPDQVRSLFEHCDVFGRRFQIAEVYFKGEAIQVATYRRAPAHQGQRGRSRNVSAKGKILKDNRFGEIREDAFRRDLTINSLYLHPSSMEIVDYTGGYDDAMQKIVRTIGHPVERFREDPARILRAIRFVTLPGFKLDAQIEQALMANAQLLADVSNYRLVEELNKMLFNGRAQASMECLHQYEIFRHLFTPYYWLHSKLHDDHGLVDWIRLTLAETDERIQIGEHTSIAYTYAAILWPKFKYAISKRSKRKHPAFRRIAHGILSQQKERTFLSGHMVQRIDEIWQFQRQLESGLVSGGERLADHKIFRSALRLFELRAKVGEVDDQVCRDWVHLRNQQPDPPRQRRTRFRRRARRP